MADALKVPKNRRGKGECARPPHSPFAEKLFQGEGEPEGFQRHKIRTPRGGVLLPGGEC